MTATGGSPSSSTLEKPVVYYNSIGDFDVTLTVQNSLGSDSVVKTAIIHVFNPPTSALPLLEDFESGTFPPTDWQIVDFDGSITWQEASVGGFGTSAHAAVVPNFNNSLNGQKDLLISPAFDLSSLTNPYLKFDVAYARIPSRPDSLAIYYTSNCGILKTYIYKKTALTLATAGILTSNFVPNAVQWRIDSVMLPSISGDVQIGFESTNGYGNNLYVDNINIYNNVVAVNELYSNINVTVMPNPASGYVKFYLSGITSSALLHVEILNSGGDIVSAKNKIENGETTISLEKMPGGLYIYNIRNKDGAIIKAGKIIHL